MDIGEGGQQATSPENIDGNNKITEKVADQPNTTEKDNSMGNGESRADKIISDPACLISYYVAAVVGILSLLLIVAVCVCMCRHRR